MKYRLYVSLNGDVEVKDSLSIDDIGILLKIHENDINKSSFWVKPEIKEYDMVFNKKVSDIGEVLSFNDELHLIDNISEIESINWNTTIINSSHNLLTWRVNDLIVIGNSTID